jgi:hypothetical protein
MGVQAEGLIDAAVENPFQDEVQRPQFGQHIPPDGGRCAVPEDLCHALLGHLLDQYREELRSIGDDADVEGVSLVTCAAVCDSMQRDAENVARHRYSTKVKVAGTRLRGTRHEAELSRGVIVVRTPPPPAGPQV